MLSHVETPYIYRIVKRALAAHVPLFLTNGTSTTLPTPPCTSGSDIREHYPELLAESIAAYFNFNIASLG
jgi:hypothetical protein